MKGLKNILSTFSFLNVQRPEKHLETSVETSRATWFLHFSRRALMEYKWVKNNGIKGLETNEKRKKAVTVTMVKTTIGDF